MAGSLAATLRRRWTVGRGQPTVPCSMRMGRGTERAWLKRSSRGNSSSSSWGLGRVKAVLGYQAQPGQVENGRARGLQSRDGQRSAGRSSRRTTAVSFASVGVLTIGAASFVCPPARLHAAGAPGMDSVRETSTYIRSCSLTLTITFTGTVTHCRFAFVWYQFRFLISSTCALLAFCCFGYLCRGHTLKIS